MDLLSAFTVFENCSPVDPYELSNPTQPYFWSNSEETERILSTQWHTFSFFFLLSEALFFIIGEGVALKYF